MRFPNNGRRFKPIDLLPLRHHSADHGHRRRLEVVLLHQIRNRPQRSGQGPLPTGRRPTGQRNRRLLPARASPALRKSTATAPHPSGTPASRRFREVRVVQTTLLLRRVLVTGKNRQLRTMIPMRHRNPRVGRTRNRRRNPRHNLKRHPRRRQFRRFLSTAPENHRITTLQAHHDLPLLRLLHDQVIDPFLRQRMVLRPLPNVNFLTIGPTPNAKTPDYSMHHRSRHPPSQCTPDL